MMYDDVYIDMCVQEKVFDCYAFLDPSKVAQPVREAKHAQPQPQPQGTCISDVMCVVCVCGEYEDGRVREMCMCVCVYACVHVCVVRRV